MAKTTGGKKATGKGSTEPTTKVTAAKSASSTRTTSSATSAPAGKKTAAGTAQAAPASAARTRAAARPDSGPAKPAAKRASAKSARDTTAAADETAVRTTHAPTVQPAVVQQPRVDIAGTANSMTKKLNEVSVDDDANQSDEQPAPAAAPGKSKVRDRRAKEKALLKEAFATSTPGTAEEPEERRVT